MWVFVFNRIMICLMILSFFSGCVFIVKRGVRLPRLPLSRRLAAVVHEAGSPACKTVQGQRYTRPRRLCLIGWR
jgi:hypothetical protein